MTIRESMIKDETVYVAALDLQGAVFNVDNGPVFDTPQEAYNAVGYFDAQEYTWEVFEFRTLTRIKKVDPPYTKR